MDETLELQPCRVQLVREIASRPKIGGSFRVTGWLRQFDPACRCGRICQETSQIPVDLAEVNISGVQDGDLVQVLGEMCSREAPAHHPSGSATYAELILKARIVRRVHGMDMGLYARCLQVRREFEARFCPDHA